MSDVQPRPARGRSSARGGRGGHGSRGPRSSKQTNGDLTGASIDTSADQGELGELKRRYQSQLTTLKELFPDWTDVDLLLTVEESDGDLQATIEKISEGNVSQFAEVKKAKDRSRSKVKEPSAPADGVSTLRGGRGNRGGDSVRGRGRGTDRGRGGFRGGRGGATNGTRGAPSVPTIESPAWDAPAASAEVKEDGQAKSSEHATESEAPKPVPAAPPAKKTWASMLAPKPAPVPPKPVAKPAPQPLEPSPAPAETPAHEVAQEPAVEAEELPIPPVADEAVEEPPIGTEDTSKLTPDEEEPAGPELTLTPSKDELTQDNVEHLPDTTNHPPLTETVASTVASSKDIGSIASVATPLSSSAQAPIGRPGIGGFATTALKATSGAHRSASFQRRLMEQQEAVVMPGNHAVNQAAVQFGSLGLNGDADNLDVDEDREEAETRTQPPQHSPVAQPRASLPPAPRQAPPAEPQPEALPTPKQAPGLPPPQQQPISQQSPSIPLAAQQMQSQGSQGNQPYNQFGRYGQAGMQSDTAAPPQKPYDPFGQQVPQQSSQYDYPTQQQSQQQSQTAGFSSAPDSFSSQYLTSDQQRSAYPNYYQNYGQQNTASQQEAGSAQQRTGSAFGAGPTDSSFSQSQQQQQAQSRYSEAQNSGHTTPNPALGGQHPTGPASQQAQHMQQPHAQPGHTGNYPYNHPYYGSPYYASYMNQFGGYGQGGYGGFGKGMYGQPHHYGMSPQASFDQHSSSPANVGGFGASSMHGGRDSGLSGGLSDYSRSVSGATQNQHSATAGSGGFGGLNPEMFGRVQAGYGNQSSYGQQQTGQQGGNEDSLKPFNDSKSGGPSPSGLGAQPGRPGSATNTAPGQSGPGGLPQQSHQQGFGGYPGHLNQLQGGQGNQYGGLGGLGHQGAGSHQQSGYGNYGGFGQGYGSYNRGGWGTNYGQH